MSGTETEYMLTGEQIKEIRQKYGLSQQEFGSRLGVTHAHISKIESGKENPSETLLKLIQYEFNVKVEGIPSADTTKPKIKKYLSMLYEIIVQGNMSDGCLYNLEFILAAFITILQETKSSGMYQELLLESLGGIIDEVSVFLTKSKDEMQDTKLKTLQSTKLQRAKKRN